MKKSKDVFVSNLRITKELLGYSQEQLAIKLNRKRSTVGAWLEGRSAPRLQDLPDVVRVFRIRDLNKFITKKIA